MRSTLMIFLLASSLSPLFFGTSFSAQPIELQHLSVQLLEQQFQLVMPGLKQVSTQTQNRLIFLRKHTDQNRVNHIRMQQYYEGFLVEGGYAILHTKADAKNLTSVSVQHTSMNGTVYAGLVDELGKPGVKFVKNADLALKKFTDQYKDKALSQQTVMPIVYTDAQHHAHWAYRVSVLVQYFNKIPERPTAIIDAQTFKSYKQWDEIKTMTEMGIIKPALATGFGGNEKSGLVTYGQELPLLNIRRDVILDRCVLENDGVKVVNMNHGYVSVNNAMHVKCVATEIDDEKVYIITGRAGDGYDKFNGAYSPSNDALYAGNVIKQLYKEWYNMDVLETFSGEPMQLIMRVHFGEDWLSAYWDGEQMNCGDGDDKEVYPLVSLGIAGHEVSHGFTQQHSNLEYNGQSGAINEAFSDMAAQAAEFYSRGKSDFRIAPEIMRANTALRYMDLPSRDSNSIDSADQYTDMLDVHHSSGVYNRLFYLIATTTGWDQHKAFDIMVKANVDYWTPTETFVSGGCGILNATKDLGYSLGDVKKALTSVAITLDQCNV